MMDLSRDSLRTTMLTVIVLAGLALAQSPISAQTPGAGGQRAGGPPAEPPKNLQVLPKDIPRQQLLQRMQSFTQGLGVQCGYCHVYEAPNNPANDMASDAKTPKLVARVMMQMTDEINQKLAANIKKPAGQITTVGCMTCHRGEALPKVPPPAAAPGRGGAGGPGGPGTPGGPGAGGRQ